MIGFIQIYRRATTLHFLITQICVVFSKQFVYTYTSIALFQLITYPDKTNVSMCSMWIFPRSVPTYNHLLWSGRWMQVILLKTNYTINTRYQEVQTVEMLTKSLDYFTFYSNVNITSCTIKGFVFVQCITNRETLSTGKTKFKAENATCVNDYWPVSLKLETLDHLRYLLTEVP